MWELFESKLYIVTVRALFGSPIWGENKMLLIRRGWQLRWGLCRLCKQFLFFWYARFLIKLLLLSGQVNIAAIDALFVP